MLKSLRYIEDNTTWFTFFWYLAWFEGILDNLELTHPDAANLIDKGVISAARSITLDHSQQLIELWRKH